MNLGRNTSAALILLTLGSLAPIASAQGIDRGVEPFFGNEITYQGELNQSGSPANGLYDMRFSLYSTSGIQIHAPVTIAAVSVVDGVFTVEIPFGASAWNDDAPFEKFLQIEVRNAGSGSYTALAPRTKLTATPHAQVARTAQALVFPYTESISGLVTNESAMTLDVSSGTAMHLVSSNPSSPVLLVEGNNPYAESFFSQSALFNDNDSYLGLVSVADRFSLVGYNNSPDGLGAVLGEVGFGGSTSAAAFYGTNSVGGTSAFLANGDYAGLFGGDIHVSGEATKNYSSSPSPMAPVAYGFINSSGSVGSATANLSAVWNSSLSQYEVTIAGESIAFSTHTSIVTVVDSSEPHVATTNVSGGKILVKIWDINSGNIAVADNFQIVIYNANPTALRAVDPVPAGMDPEYYYQRTGTTPYTAPPAAEVQMPEPGSAIED